MREQPDCLKACHFHSVYRAEQLPLAGAVVGDASGSRAVVPLASGNQKEGKGGKEEKKKGRLEQMMRQVGGEGQWARTGSTLSSSSTGWVENP